ncbi:MAG: ABC transporter ATP-binding protein [Desulfobulbaceae bacterium]|nr:ABC transporter ATP-binding protein [Desulfobulbaceae bacterium]
MALAALQELSHHYHSGSRSIQVLNGINLEVKQGDFVAIMGRSGSGKSTLLHILGGLLQPRIGHYLFKGMDVFSMSTNEIAIFRGKHIGFVFQMFHLLPEMNVLENVKLPFLYNNTDPNEAESLAREAVELTGISHRLLHKPSELSGGEMQRVAIARALAPGPELILADEPTGNLDSITGEEIISLFELLNTTGKTVVMVTHDQRIAQRAHIIKVLTDGRLQ